MIALLIVIEVAKIKHN